MPSTCTVQAPHWAIPQPYLVPIRPSWSRSTQSSGVSGSASTSTVWPLTVRLSIGSSPRPIAGGRVKLTMPVQLSCASRASTVRHGELGWGRGTGPAAWDAWRARRSRTPHIASGPSSSPSAADPQGARQTTVTDLLEQVCRERVAALPGPQDPRARAENVIIELLPYSTPSLERVARRLGMSRRSLGRRLAEEGTSFKELLDELRRELARRYLEQGVHRPKSIAALLGYKDLSAFHHAFRRWTGTTPAKFCEGLLA